MVTTANSISDLSLNSVNACWSRSLDSGSRTLAKSPTKPVRGGSVGFASAGCWLAFTGGGSGEGDEVLTPGTPLNEQEQLRAATNKTVTRAHFEESVLASSSTAKLSWSFTPHSLLKQCSAFVTCLMCR